MISETPPQFKQSTLNPKLSFIAPARIAAAPKRIEVSFVTGSTISTTLFPDSHIFLTSSTSVYGQTDGSEVDEESPAQPDRETGHLLREAEENLIRYQGTVLRLAGIYGPARSVHLKKFLEGTASIETGEISRYLNQIHLDDIISAIKHLISLDARTQTRGHIYNIADDTPMTQRECYEGLAAIFEKPIPDEAEPNMSRKRAWTNKKISIKKLKSLGWTPNFPSFF